MIKVAHTHSIEPVLFVTELFTICGKFCITVVK